MRHFAKADSSQKAAETTSSPCRCSVRLEQVHAPQDMHITDRSPASAAIGCSYSSTSAPNKPIINGESRPFHNYALTKRVTIALPVVRARLLSSTWSLSVEVLVLNIPFILTLFSTPTHHFVDPLAMDVSLGVPVLFHHQVATDFWSFDHYISRQETNH